MKFSLSLTSVLALACAMLPAASATSEVTADFEPRAKEIFMSSPACAYYQCRVTWRKGETVTISWLEAPKGGLKIELVPEQQGLKTHLVTSHVGSIHNKDQCAAEANGKSCGQTTWVVPDNIKLGEYSILATSVAHPSIKGYTDVVAVKKASSKRAAQ